MYSMSLDFDRLGAAIANARTARGWFQVDLAAAAHVSESTVQNFEGGRPFRREPSTLKHIEAALGWERGSGMIVARGGEPTLLPAVPVAPEPSSSLIDPGSPDPVIRELSTGPVANDAMREELIRLYLEDLAEMQDRARERARIRAQRLAAAAAQPTEYEPVREGQDPDSPGHGRATA
jgi:transcriptional regulator with XRE-family HTH domain